MNECTHAGVDEIDICCEILKLEGTSKVEAAHGGSGRSNH